MTPQPLPPQAATAVEMARLLGRALDRLPWPELADPARTRYADRQRLGRALHRLAGQLDLARTALGCAPEREAAADAVDTVGQGSAAAPVRASRRGSATAGAKGSAPDP